MLCLALSFILCYNAKEWIWIILIIYIGFEFIFDRLYVLYMTNVFVESENTCVYQDLHAHGFKVFKWKKLSLHDKN